MAIRIVTTRAPGLIPSLIQEIEKAEHPVVLIPESFTLACETEIVKSRQEKGIFNLKIFSPSSLIREIRELTGHGSRRPITGDGQNMIISQVLHHCREELKYYRDSAAQPTLAAKIAGQIDEFTRARLNPAFLREYQPSSRRTGAKLADVALIWEGYQTALNQGFEDTVGQWMSAIGKIQESGLIRGKQLLIYGFDYITHDLLNLAEAAAAPVDRGGAAEIVIGLISDDAGPDREIFRAANDSVIAFEDSLKHHGKPFTTQRVEFRPDMDPGIAYVEKTIYATGAFAGPKTRRHGQETVIIRDDPARVKSMAMKELAETFVPDLSRVHLYYARNSYLECQHACQTLIAWRQAGIPWEEMAVAVCEQQTLPSLLPLTLTAAGIPFNAKQDQPILMSGYAQYFLSLLRILRLNFCQEDVLRMIKTGFTALQPREAMDMENYARANGIHRSRWLKPFHMPEKESQRVRVQPLEELRKQLIDPIAELKKNLSRKECTGKQAATLLFQFITEAGIYDRLTEQEEELAAQRDDLGIDRNRQVWTAVNELLDMLATFIGDEAIPLKDLCAMLEASLSSRMIKSLPQQSKAVMVAPPQMFFSSGIRRMIVMGLQENEISASAAILSEQERNQLEQYIAAANEAYYLEQKEQTGSADLTGRPYSRIGQPLMDLAARQKQDVYQAVSLAREELVLSCSSARPNGGVMTPSTAFRRMARTVAKMNPGNYTGGLMNPDIRPFAPAFALEALAVRLRESRDDREPLFKGDGADGELWKNALGSLYQSREWNSKVQGVLKGLHVTAPTAHITPEQAKKLYITHGFTISRVETFGSCPYRHLLQYGLDLFPAASYAFQRNEQGTFNHDVIQVFLNEAMKMAEWPRLSEETQRRLLNRILKERVKKWEGGILTSDTLHRYQGASIIRGVRTAIFSMMRTFQQENHFLPMATEVPFGTPDGTGRIRLPAIQIQTSDGDTVAFSGRIDRIDRLEAEDGTTYFLIVDNKMASKEVKQNSIAAGLQLQLPLYIRAAQEGLGQYRAAGGLYQPIRDVLVESEDREQIRAGIDKELRMAGMILDNKEIQEAVKPVRISRRSEKNDTISAVTPEEMEALTDGSVEIIRESVNRIRGGEATPRPLKDGLESPCRWCDHAEACIYDSTIPGCRMAEVDHKRRTDLPRIYRLEMI